MSNEGKKLKRLSNREIEKEAIRYVLDYLKDENAIRPKKGADIISKGRHIEVKGCLKKATNLRMSEQMLKSVEGAGKLKKGSFFIYYVFDIASGNPKLMIFDYDTFDRFKFEEKKLLIQPQKIKNKTGKPEVIDLKSCEKVPRKQ